MRSTGQLIQIDYQEKLSYTIFKYHQTLRLKAMLSSVIITVQRVNLRKSFKKMKTVWSSIVSNWLSSLTTKQRREEERKEGEKEREKSKKREKRDAATKFNQIY